MVDGSSPTTRSLEEVVDDVLLLPVPEIPMVRLHFERSAEQRGARHFAVGSRGFGRVRSRTGRGSRDRAGGLDGVLGVLTHGGQLLGLARARPPSSPRRRSAHATALGAPTPAGGFARISLARLELT